MITIIIVSLYILGNELRAHEVPFMSKAVTSHAHTHPPGHGGDSKY